MKSKFLILIFLLISLGSFAATVVPVRTLMVKTNDGTLAGRDTNFFTANYAAAIAAGLGGSGGSATNVNFIAGQNTTPTTVGGSNQFNLSGSITNPVASKGAIIGLSLAGQDSGITNSAGSRLAATNGPVIFHATHIGNLSGTADASGFAFSFSDGGYTVLANLHSNLTSVGTFTSYGFNASGGSFLGLVGNNFSNSFGLNLAPTNAGIDGQIFVKRGTHVGLESVTGTGDALTSNPLSQFAATTSAQLAGIISDESGSGALLFASGNGSSLTALNASQLSSGTTPDARYGTPAFNAVNVTNIPATNLVNGRWCVNVQSYGALPTAGTLNCFTGVSNAIAFAKTNRFDIWFPPSPYGTYYLNNGTFVLDAVDWNSQVNLPNATDTSAKIYFHGEGAIIIQTNDAPLFRLTNGINSVVFSGFDLRHSSATGVGAAASTHAAIEIWARASDGDNSDHIDLYENRFAGWKQGVYAESLCNSTLIGNQFELNQYPLWLVNTNPAGTATIYNNAVTIIGGDMVNNWNGMFVRGAVGLEIIGVESGGTNGVEGYMQTNFMEIEASSAASVIISGGSSELYAGAAVAVFGGSGNASTVRIMEDHFGLTDFSPGGTCWNIYNTNTTFGPRVVISSSILGAGALASWDAAGGYLFTSLQDSTIVRGSNATFGNFTNSIGLIGGAGSAFDAASSTLPVLKLFGGSAVGTVWAGVSMAMTPESRTGTDSKTGWIGGRIKNLYDQGAYGTRTVFSVNGGTAVDAETNVLTLFQNAGVRVGDTNAPPGAKGLGVAGNLNVDGTLTGNGGGLTNLNSATAFPGGAVGVITNTGSDGDVPTKTGGNFKLQAPSGGSQTPYTSAHNAAGFSITNIGSLEVTNGSTLQGATTFKNASGSQTIGVSVTTDGFLYINNGGNNGAQVAVQLKPASNGVELGNAADGIYWKGEFTSITATGTSFLTNGVASYSSNKLAVTSISVGASPFNWTNTLTKNVFVFVDGAGVSVAAAINGTTVYAAVTGGDYSLPLQPGEWVTLTYTVGTPVAKWKPF